MRCGEVEVHAPFLAILSPPFDNQLTISMLRSRIRIIWILHENAFSRTGYASY